MSAFLLKLLKRLVCTCTQLPAHNNFKEYNIFKDSEKKTKQKKLSEQEKFYKKDCAFCVLYNRKILSYNFVQKLITSQKQKVNFGVCVCACVKIYIDDCIYIHELGVKRSEGVGSII